MVNIDESKYIIYIDIPSLRLLKKLLITKLFKYLHVTIGFGFVADLLSCGLICYHAHIMMFCDVYNSEYSDWFLRTVGRHFKWHSILIITFLKITNKNCRF